MRVRRARALVVTWHRGRLQATNFLQKQSFVCNVAGLDLLSSLSEWTRIEQVFARLHAFGPRSVAREIRLLIDVGALVVEDTRAAARDTAYDDEWEWGVLAGLYHFGIRDTKFLDHKATVRHIQRRAGAIPSPVNYTVNDGAGPCHQLPPVDVSGAVFTAMRRRRTIRGFRKRSVSKAQIAACLHAGLGIVGFYQDRLLGRMPVKMTPSGGARNPYEAYVYALNIRGVAKGVYHYSALENSLQLVNASDLPKPGQLLSGQHYTNDAGAIIFLVANFWRTMWKYQHPTAYRVVLIEAGHIAQNMAIAAATHRLTANPTAALQDSAIDRTLGITPPLQAAVYALTVGHPDPRHAPRRVRTSRP